MHTKLFEKLKNIMIDNKWINAIESLYLYIKLEILFKSEIINIYNDILYINLI